jgi:hypothetical protein
MTRTNGREPVDEMRHREHGPFVKAVVQSFRTSVRQLFIPPNRSGLDVASLGSVCLISLGGWRFVLTAGHVAAAKPHCARYIMVDGELVEIVGFRQYEAAGEIAKDLFDVAIAQLDVGTADRFVARGCGFLDPSQFDTSLPATGASTPVYAALGYPHNTTKRIAQRWFRAQPLIFSSGALDLGEYERLGLNPHIHLAIQCDQKKVRSDKGVHSLKALDGMSGGALLRLPSRSALMHGAQPTLAGIITEQDTQGQALIAIRIDGILVAMSHTPALWAY